MDRAALSPLLRSFERHLRAENRSDRTVASYLVALRQAEAFLAARGIGLVDAGRADLEAFLGDLLTYRAASTAATYYKVLRFLYRWLDEEDEIDGDPTAKMKIIGYRDLATLSSRSSATITGDTQLTSQPRRPLSSSLPDHHTGPSPRDRKEREWERSS